MKEYQNTLLAIHSYLMLRIKVDDEALELMTKLDSVIQYFNVQNRDMNEKFPTFFPDWWIHTENISNE